MILYEYELGPAPTPPRGPAGDTAHLLAAAIARHDAPPPRLALFVAEYGRPICQAVAFALWIGMALFIGYWWGM